MVTKRERQPFASSPAIRVRMQNQLSRNTGPELKVRTALHALGLRYRVHQRPVPELRRNADVVFRSTKVAVFIDGCYWHGCSAHGQRDHKVNGWYWPAKIQRNVDRDRDTDRRLREAGWEVVRVWEHEDPTTVAVQIQSIVRSRRVQAR
jgi:DNA mismatch endonuclease, patch repair protein